MTRRFHPRIVGSADFLQRFWSRVRVTDGCWLWSGPKDAAGYGIFTTGREIAGRQCRIRAHRLAWTLANASVLPVDLMACHRCDNPSCVNPSHLFDGTAKDNYDDMIAKGRRPKVLRPREFCRKRGHALTPDNIYIRGAHRRRECRECNLIWQRSARARRSA